MKRFIAALAALLTAALLCMGAGAESTEKIIDNAGLFSESTKQRVESYIEDYSGKYTFEGQYNIDFVILTTDSIDGMDIRDYAEKKYDELNVGIGRYKDGYPNGALLVIYIGGGKGNNLFIIHTEGFAHNGVFTQRGMDHIIAELTPQLAEKDFDGAILHYMELCGEFLGLAQSGTPYGTGKDFGDLALFIFIGLILGLITALIVCLILKSRMQTAVPKPDANDYVRSGSFNVTKKRDIFLYTNITRRKRESSSSSSSSNSPGGSGSSVGRF